MTEEQKTPSLAGDAERVLAGREGYLNIHMPSPLSAWAKRRHKERKKAERAARKASRRAKDGR